MPGSCLRAVLRGGVRATACLGLVLLCGCAALILPEERAINVREPAQIPAPPPVEISEPETVSQRRPAAAATMSLSLDEAIHIALANSKVVRVLAGVTAVSSGQTIYDPAISVTDIDDARSVFDPTLFVNNNWNRTEQPRGVFAPSSPAGAIITGTRVDDYDLGLGLSQRNLLGGTAKFEHATNIARFTPGIFPLNPEQRSATTLSYTQPLLKGAGVTANAAPIVIARINTERSYFQFKDSVQELVRGVIEAYWAVAFAKVDVAATRQQVEQAEFTFKLAEARRRLGIKNIGEEAQTRAALANFRANLIAAEANLLNREAALRNILGLPPSEPERLELTTEPSKLRVEPKWDEIIRLAQERRPDLIELRLILEADQQTVLLANNQARPQLDAVMFHRWNGLEGRTPSNAWIESGPGQFTDWTLGVNFSVPLGLRKDRAGLRRAELLVKRDQANLEQGVHSMMHTLAASLRNLAQFYEQYEAFNEARKAAQQNVNVQLAEFKADRTILLNVLQAIADLGNATSSQAQALAQYNTELANLEKETGTILDTHAVKFLEERFRAIGPFGRHGPGRLYPEAVVPAVAPRQMETPDGDDASEKSHFEASGDQKRNR
jgi:outer membrane protein TolC